MTSLVKIPILNDNSSTPAYFTDICTKDERESLAPDICNLISRNGFEDIQKQDEDSEDEITITFVGQKETEIEAPNKTCSENTVHPSVLPALSSDNTNHLHMNMPFFNNHQHEQALSESQITPEACKDAQSSVNVVQDMDRQPYTFSSITKPFESNHQNSTNLLLGNVLSDEEPCMVPKPDPPSTEAECITLSDSDNSNGVPEKPLIQILNEKPMPQLLPLSANAMKKFKEEKVEEIPVKIVIAVKKPQEVVADVPSSPEMPILIPFTSENEEPDKKKKSSGASASTENSLCSQKGYQPKVILRRLSLDSSNSKVPTSFQEILLQTTKKFIDVENNCSFQFDQDCIEGNDFVSFSTKEEVIAFFNHQQSNFLLDGLTEDDKSCDNEMDEDDEVVDDDLESTTSLFADLETRDTSFFREWYSKSSQESEFTLPDYILKDIPLCLAANRTGANSLESSPTKKSEFQHSIGKQLSSGSTSPSTQIMDSDTKPPKFFKNEEMKPKLSGSSLFLTEPKNKSAFLSEDLENFLQTKSDLCVPWLEKTNPNIKPIPRDAPILSVGSLSREPSVLAPQAYRTKLSRKRLLVKRKLFEMEMSSQQSDTENDSTPPDEKTRIDVPVSPTVKSKPQNKTKSNSILASNNILKKSKKQWKQKSDVDISQRVVVKIKRRKYSNDDYKVTSISSISTKIEEEPSKDVPKPKPMLEKVSRSPTEKGVPVLIRETFFTEGNEKEEENLLNEFLTKLNHMGTRNNVMMLVNSNQAHFETVKITPKAARGAVSAVGLHTPVKQKKGPVPKHLNERTGTKLKRKMPPPTEPKRRRKRSKNTTLEKLAPLREKRSIRLPVRFKDSEMFADSEYVSPDTSQVSPPSMKSNKKISKTYTKDPVEVKSDMPSSKIKSVSLLTTEVTAPEETVSLKCTEDPIQSSNDDTSSSSESGSDQSVKNTPVPETSQTPMFASGRSECLPDYLERNRSGKRIKVIPYCYCSNVSRVMPYVKTLNTLCCPCISTSVSEQVTSCSTTVREKTAKSVSSALNTADKEVDVVSTETTADSATFPKQLGLHNYAAMFEDRDEEKAYRKLKAKALQEARKEMEAAKLENPVKRRRKLRKTPPPDDVSLDKCIEVEPPTSFPPCINLTSQSHSDVFLTSQRDRVNISDPRAFSIEAVKSSASSDNNPKLSIDPELKSSSTNRVVKGFVIKPMPLDLSKNPVTFGKGKNGRTEVVITQEKQLSPTRNIVVKSSDLLALLKNNRNSNGNLQKPTLVKLSSNTDNQNVPAKYILAESVHSGVVSTVSKNCTGTSNGSEKENIESSIIRLCQPPNFYSSPATTNGLKPVGAFHRMPALLVPPSNPSVASAASQQTSANPDPTTTALNNFSDPISSEVDSCQETILNSNISQTCDWKLCENRYLSPPIEETPVLEIEISDSNSGTLSSKCSDDEVDIDYTDDSDKNEELCGILSQNESSLSNSSCGNRFSRKQLSVKLPLPKRKIENSKMVHKSKCERIRRKQIRQSVEILRSTLGDYKPGSNLIDVLACGKTAIDDMTQQSMIHHCMIKDLLLKRQNLSEKLRALATDSQQPVNVIQPKPQKCPEVIDIDTEEELIVDDVQPMQESKTPGKLEELQHSGSSNSNNECAIKEKPLKFSASTNRFPNFTSTIKIITPNALSSTKPIFSISRTANGWIREDASSSEKENNETSMAIHVNKTENANNEPEIVTLDDNSNDESRVKYVADDNVENLPSSSLS